MHYDIRGLVKFSLDGPDRFSQSVRYSHYRTKNLNENELDFIVTLGVFKPDTADCLLLDHNTYVKEGYFYRENDSYKLVRWDIEVRFSENGPSRININIRPRILKNMRIAYVIVEGALVEPLILWALTRKGFALIHASCIARNGEGWLFAARSGAGKTVLSSYFVSIGYEFVSDNYTILSHDGSVIGLWEPLNIFFYNMSKGVRRSLSIWQRIALKLKHVIYTLSRGYVKIFTTKHPLEVYETASETCVLRGIFVLLPVDGVGNQALERKVTTDELSEQIACNQQLEFPYFCDYILGYSYAFPNGTVSKYWEDYRKAVKNSVGSQLHRIEIPRPLDERATREAAEVIIRAL